MPNPAPARVAAIVPCYKVKAQILAVLAAMPEEVHGVFVVDDACPEESGKVVVRECQDPRVQVVLLPENLGIGGAVMAGYKAAIAANYDVLVKIDGDGQIEPQLASAFVQPSWLARPTTPKATGSTTWNAFDRCPRCACLATPSCPS